MKKLYYLFLLPFFLSSCYNNSYKEFPTDDKAITNAIYLLKESKNQNSNNLYYIIKTNKYLYVINTNKENRLPFMYLYNIIDCKNDNEGKILIYLSKYEGSRLGYFNAIDKNCIDPKFNIIDYYSENKQIENMLGVIYKISKENKLILDRYGNIKKELINDKYLDIEIGIEVEK